MSKVGKKPITIPPGVTLKIENNFLVAEGKEGTITLPILPYTNLKIEGNTITVVSSNTEKQGRANWGTMRALTQNTVNGVSQGFTKELEIQGVGFKASMEGDILMLNVGFTHPIKFKPPAGVKISVEKNFIKIYGAEKNLVGQAAANIRSIKKPEPYKGKGIRYKGEIVKIKAGKKVAGATGATGA